MAEITFFEKTGCINNTKQKQILELAGHHVNAINLEHYNWKKEELLNFFSGMLAKDCFNRNAPSVSSGEIVPEEYSMDDAIEAMLSDHLLIKRPLMIIGEEKIVGFDKEFLDKKIGLNPGLSPNLVQLLSEDLITCPQKAKKQQCD